MTPHCIKPCWPAPANVQALSTTRDGGVSAAPWGSFNLGHHVGDSSAAVSKNRSALAAALPGNPSIQWMEQVHGVDVIEAGPGGYPRADASWSRQAGRACAVMTADCLPVLFCDRSGTVVAAAHAGWRGLAAGVLEATVSAMNVSPDELLAWMGPAIGPGAFEVGPEVREVFLVQSAEAGDCFAANPGNPGYFLADLYSLARQRLASVGVVDIFGGGFCTFTEEARFFSYRRDGQTGRMASLILLSDL